MLRFVFVLSLAAAASAKAQHEHLEIGIFDENIEILAHPHSFDEDINGYVASMEVLEGGKTLLKHTAVPHQVLLKTVLANPGNGNGPYLATIWSTGAHDYILLVFDLSLAATSTAPETVVHYYGAGSIVISPTTEGMEAVGLSGDHKEYESIVTETFACRWETREIEDEFKLACDEPDVVSEKIGS